MNEKQTKTLKLVIRVLIVISVVFAIIGAIGTLVIVGKISKFMNLMMSGQSSSVMQMQMLSLEQSLPAIGPMIDFARFGAFGAFLLSLMYAFAEFPTKGKEKTLSLAAAGSSVLGFVGVFLMSLTAMSSSISSAAMGSLDILLDILDSSSGTAVAALFKKMLAPLNVGSILILAGVVITLALVVMTFIKIQPKPAYNYAGQPYANQYPNQPYGQPQYPQYPQQAPAQYPNQPTYDPNAQGQYNNNNNNFNQQ